MVNYGLDNGTFLLLRSLTAVDDVMDTVDEDYAFSQASNAFGPTEFANALSENLNAHGTNIHKLLSRHGLLRRYERLAREKSLV